MHPDIHDLDAWTRQKQAAHKFAELPPEVQEWLSDLRPEEIARLKGLAAIDLQQVQGALAFWNSARTVGKFTAYALGVIFTAIVTMGAAGDALKNIVGWFRR